MSPNPFQPLLEAIIHGVLWLIPVLLAITALKALFSARLKGAAGERAVARVLNRLGAVTLHDIILPDGRGGLTQIDHLVLTQAGLLVVETKNYAGHAKHGRDWRRPLAWGLLAVAGLWIAVLLLGGQKIDLGLFDTYAGQEGRAYQVARPVR